MLSPAGGSDEMDHLAHWQCRRDLGQHLPRGLLATSREPMGMLVRGATDHVRWKGTKAQRSEGRGAMRAPQPLLMALGD